MQREHLVMFCYCDIAAQVRGKGFPVSQLAKRLRTGIGWTPTNIMLTAFGPIAESPWGPFGDLLLMPDPATEVDVEFGEEHPREHFFLADVLQTDGQPWDCCPRTFLKALAALEQQAGLRLVSAFEQEFYYEGADERLGSATASMPSVGIRSSARSSSVPCTRLASSPSPTCPSMVPASTR